MLQVQAQSSGTEFSPLGIPGVMGGPSSGYIPHEDLRAIYGAGLTRNQGSEGIRRRRSLDLPPTRRSTASPDAPTAEQRHASSPWLAVGNKTSPSNNSKGVQDCPQSAADSLVRRRVAKGQMLSTGTKARFTSFGSGSELGFSLSGTPHGTQISPTGNSDKPEPDKILKATLCSTGPHTQQAGGHQRMEQGVPAEEAKLPASLQGCCLPEPTSPNASGAGVEIFFFQDQQAGPSPSKPSQGSSKSSDIQPFLKDFPTEISQSSEDALKMATVTPYQPYEAPLQPSPPLVKELSFTLPVKPAEVLFIDSDDSPLLTPPVSGLNETKGGSQSNAPPSQSWSFSQQLAHGADTDEAGSSGIWQLLGNSLQSTASAEVKVEAHVPRLSSRANRNSMDSFTGDAKFQNQGDKMQSQDWCHPARPSGPALGLSSLRRSQSGIPAGYGVPKAPARSTSPLSLSPVLPSERPMSSGGRTSRFAQEELRALLGESKGPQFRLPASAARGLRGHHRESSLKSPLKTMVVREHRSAFSMDGAAGDILQGSSLLPSRSPLKSAKAPSTNRSSTSGLPSATRSSPALVSKSPLRYTGSNSRERVSIDLGIEGADAYPPANPELNDATLQLDRPLPSLASACPGAVTGSNWLGIPGSELGSPLSASGLRRATHGGVMKRPERQNSLPSFVSALASEVTDCENEQSPQVEALKRGEEKEGEGKLLSFEAAFSRCCKLESEPRTGDFGSPSRSPSALKPILVLRQEGLQHARSLGRRVRFKKRVDVVIFS